MLLVRRPHGCTRRRGRAARGARGAEPSLPPLGRWGLVSVVSAGGDRDETHSAPFPPLFLTRGRAGGRSAARRARADGAPAAPAGRGSRYRPVVRPPAPVRSRVTHARSHTHTSHRPHRSEFSPCRVMSWPCRANDVLINAERAAQSAATGDYSRTKSPNPHVPSTLCTSYELCVAHAHGIAAHRRVYPSGIRADAPPTLKLTTPQPAKGISPQIMLVIL